MTLNCSSIKGLGKCAHLLYCSATRFPFISPSVFAGTHPPPPPLSAPSKVSVLGSISNHDFFSAHPRRLRIFHAPAHDRVPSFRKRMGDTARPLNTPKHILPRYQYIPQRKNRVICVRQNALPVAYTHGTPHLLLVGDPKQLNFCTRTNPLVHVHVIFCFCGEVHICFRLEVDSQRQQAHSTEGRACRSTDMQIGVRRLHSARRLLVALGSRGGVLQPQNPSALVRIYPHPHPNYGKYTLMRSLRLRS